MKKLLLALVLVLPLAACGSGVYKIPKQEYQTKVQVLGVLPILVDRASGVDYPQAQALFDLVERSTVGKEKYLVDKLKEKKGYFDIRPISLHGGLVAMSLIGNGRKHDAKGYPAGYMFDTATVVEMARSNVVDAVLIVVLSGEKVTETRRSRTKLESLNTQYSDILATAAVIDRNGNVLWQMSGPEAVQFLQLQYPDFDEAYFNRTDYVKVKDITLSGFERVLAEDPDRDGVRHLPRVYDDLFSGIAAGISPNLLDVLRR